MKKRGWSGQVVLRYALFQLPALVVLIAILTLVRLWVDLPQWLIWGLVALWAAKDVVFFPFVWRSYDVTKRPGDTTSMIGADGIVEDQLAPRGYVRVRGELWRAEVAGGGPPIDKGGRILVRDVRGLTLLVLPGNEEDDEKRNRSKNALSGAYPEPDND